MALPPQVLLLTDNRDPSLQIIPIMENQMEKKMEHERETVVIIGFI